MRNTSTLSLVLSIHYRATYSAGTTRILEGDTCRIITLMSNYCSTRPFLTRPCHHEQKTYFTDNKTHTLTIEELATLYQGQTMRQQMRPSASLDAN